MNMVKKVVKKRNSSGHDRQAFAGGITIGIIFLLLTLAAKFFGIFGETMNILLDIYEPIGYDISYFGILLGGIYGFATGFLIFCLHSWILNKL